METIIDTATVAILKNKASFQDGATPNIVVIARTDTSKVVLLAFKRGQELKQHVAPQDVMVQVLEGRITFDVADHGERTLIGGDFMLLDKDTPHSVQAIEDTKVLLTLL